MSLKYNSVYDSTGLVKIDGYSFRYDLLKPKEKKIYDALVLDYQTEANKTEYEIHRSAYKYLWLWFVKGLLTTVGVIVCSRTDQESLEIRILNLVLLVLLVVTMFGGPVYLVWLYSKGTRNHMKHISEKQNSISTYLAGIGYIERLRNRYSSSRGYERGGGERARQHQWYEGHSELDWRDRVTAELYGLDVDTYINNVKEHDRS